jgi:hypothetical protein
VQRKRKKGRARNRELAKKSEAWEVARRAGLKVLEEEEEDYGWG